MDRYQRYLKNKREERFCVGFGAQVGDLLIACGRFLGYAETGKEPFLFPAEDQDGNFVTLPLCSRCAASYRAEGMIWD